MIRSPTPIGHRRTIPNVHLPPQAMLHVEFDDALYNYVSYSPARSVRPRNKPFEDFCDIGEELGRGTQAATYHVIQRSNGGWSRLGGEATRRSWCHGVWRSTRMGIAVETKYHVPSKSMQLNSGFNLALGAG